MSKAILVIDKWNKGCKDCKLAVMGNGDRDTEYYCCGRVEEGYNNGIAVRKIQWVSKADSEEYRLANCPLRSVDGLTSGIKNVIVGAPVYLGD